jgi:hypothetical protein
MKNGTEAIPPWATAEMTKNAIQECEDRIKSLQAKLDDPQKLEEWWESVPLQIREQWVNM